MNDGFANRPKQSLRHPLRTGLMAGLAGLVLAGCASPQGYNTTSLSSDQPRNVYSPSPVLPQNVRRIAVLPLMADARDASLGDGRDALEPVLNEELIKTRKFEVVSVSSEFVKGCSGRSGWTGEEVLPNDLLNSLRETYGCDAVLFSKLTMFRAYPPLAVGWRMKLVDARTQQVLWAGDEAFDGSTEKNAEPDNRSFLQNAREWYSEDFVLDPGPENSPRKFGRQTVARLFSTLPHTVAELFASPKEEEGKDF